MLKNPSFEDGWQDLPPAPGNLTNQQPAGWTLRWLEPGENVTLRANLKRFQFADGEHWEPGEYNVRATFNLCAQTPETEATVLEEEIPVKSAKSGWFMISI